jgi:hypothetical protein
MRCWYLFLFTIFLFINNGAFSFVLSPKHKIGRSYECFRNSGFVPISKRKHLTVFSTIQIDNRPPEEKSKDLLKSNFWCVQLKIVYRIELMSLELNHDRVWKNGWKVHYEVSDSIDNGPSILLLHGFGVGGFHFHRFTRFHCLEAIFRKTPTPLSNVLGVTSVIGMPPDSWSRACVCGRWTSWARGAAGRPQTLPQMVRLPTAACVPRPLPPVIALKPKRDSKQSSSCPSLARFHTLLTKIPPALQAATRKRDSSGASGRRPTRRWRRRS